MTRDDIAVDAVLIVGPVGSERCNRAIDLIQRLVMRSRNACAGPRSMS